jgi:hypothetical protein
MISEAQILDVAVKEATPAHENNQAVLDHWLAIRGDDILPAKSSLDPMRIPHLLPNIMLLESYGTDAVFVRLCGTKIAERFGRDLTGINLGSIFPPHLRPMLDSLVTEAMGRPCGLLVHNNLPMPSGQIRQTEFIHLPLSNADGDVCFTLSSVYVLDTVMRAGELRGKITDVQQLERIRLRLN